METMLEAMARLRDRGYRLDLMALEDGRLGCGSCGEVFDARNLTVDEVVRFEGDSNPDDESILVALTMACGHKGLYSAAFGPSTPPADVEVLHALVAR